MSTPASVLDAQSQRLLQLVEDYREQRCRTLVDRAEQQSRELLGQARHDALERVREAIAAERARGRERIDTAQARQQTRRRQREQEQTLAALEQAWPQLEAALQARWQSTQTRRVWVEATVNQALHTLPGHPWTVAHPPGWDPQELEPLAAAIEKHCGEAPRMHAEETLPAGLRLCCNGACVDASIAGLLADRVRITARLLARLQDTPDNQRDRTRAEN